MESPVKFPNKNKYNECFETTMKIKLTSVFVNGRL